MIAVHEAKPRAKHILNDFLIYSQFSSTVYTFSIGMVVSLLVNASVYLEITVHDKLYLIRDFSFFYE